MSDKLLTVPEVATRLAVSKCHVWRLVLRGTIPSLKLGRNRRVTPVDLDKYLESCRAPAPRWAR